MFILVLIVKQERSKRYYKLRIKTMKYYKKKFNKVRSQDEINTIYTAIILLVAMIALTCLAIPRAVRIIETNECLRWQKEALEYPNYYLTPWQEEQCKARGVEINIK